MIYILEGADGVGKTTLAKEIAMQKGAHIIHASYNKNWNIKNYHNKLMQHAISLQKSGISVVMDRWAPSEMVYGEVFRYGPSYGIMTMIKNFRGNNIKWIYCRNDKAIENHNKNKKIRYEMFRDMTKVIKKFNEFIKNTPELNWIIYDFNISNIKDFVEDLK